MDPAWLAVIVFLLIWHRVELSGLDKEWTYRGEAGESKWSEFFPDCGGSSQSPIDVEVSRTLYDTSLHPIQPLGYNQHGHSPFTLFNNGHTVEVPLPRWMGVVGLPWLFSAVQLHLHWGNGLFLNSGSEHTIDGLGALAEMYLTMPCPIGACGLDFNLSKLSFLGLSTCSQQELGHLHVVHYNSELYANMSEAKTQRNGLAVLAVLIEAGEETNQGYGNILNYLGRIRHAGQKVAVPAFDVQTLLPKDLSRFFRYNGSLTTPPCYESVLWTVFSERVRLSHSQLQKLETILYSNKAGKTPPTVLQNNFRATQPLNQRVVLSSFIPAASVKIYTAGEITAIVLGSVCGCVGLALIIGFIVKTIRSTSSWDVLPSSRPPAQTSPKDIAKDAKQDVALKTASDPAKKEAPLQSDP